MKYVLFVSLDQLVMYAFVYNVYIHAIHIWNTTYVFNSQNLIKLPFVPKIFTIVGIICFLQWWNEIW